MNPKNKVHYAVAINFDPDEYKDEREPFCETSQKEAFYKKESICDMANEILIESGEYPCEDCKATEEYKFNLLKYRTYENG